MRDTWYGVQLFGRTARGRVALAETRDSRDADAARRTVRTLYEDGKIAGGIAFSRSGDYELGDYEDPVILETVGQVPAEVLDEA